VESGAVDEPAGGAGGVVVVEAGMVPYLDMAGCWTRAVAGGEEAAGLQRYAVAEL
jgi:hypothetical protein